MKNTLSIIILLFLIAFPAHPVVGAIGDEQAVFAAGTAPVTAIIYDDGTPERSAAQWMLGDMVALQCSPPVYPFFLQRVSVNICFLGIDPGATLELRIYGETSGMPGPLLASGLKIEGFDDDPLRYEGNAWVDVDLSSLNLVFSSGDFFVAVAWQRCFAPGIGVDSSSPDEERTWLYQGGRWQKASCATWGCNDQAMIRAFGSRSSAYSPLLLESLHYDDGSAEKGGIQQVAGDAVALRVTPPGYPFYIQRVLVNLANYGGDIEDELELRIYHDNNGVPGDPLLSGLMFSGSPIYASGNIWVDIDVSSYGIVIPRGDFYVGVVWKTPSSPGLGIDWSRPNRLRTWVCEEGRWDLLPDKYGWASQDQAMIRVLGSLYSEAPLHSLSYDDGQPDRGGIQQLSGDAVALRITPSEYPFHLRGIAVNIANFGADPTDELELQLYAEENEAPSYCILDNILFSAPPFPYGENLWTYIDLSMYGLTLQNGSFFAAAEWKTPGSPGLGIDINLPNEQRTWVREGGVWTLLSTIYPWAYEDQAMIRAIGLLELKMNLASPVSGAVLSAPPVFEWTATEGIDGVYAVDFSLSPFFDKYWSTFEQLGQPLYTTSWSVPSSIWNRLPSDTPLYWRVRGADLDQKPLVAVFSDEIWFFRKQ